MDPKTSRYYTFIRPIFRNKAVRTYSSLVFSILTITFFGVFALKPTLSTIVSLQKSITEQQQLLEKVTQKADNLSLGRQNYDAIDPQIKLKLISLLPNSTSLPSLIDVIYSLAEENSASISGLQVQSIELVGNPNRIAKQAVVQEIEFSFNSTGSYSQLSQILSSLTKLKRLISIQSASFNKQQEGALIMTVNAKAYFFKN